MTCTSRYTLPARTLRWSTEKKCWKQLPFGEKTALHHRRRHDRTHGLFQPELGDTTDEAFVANAAIIVYVDVNHMLKTWQAEING